MGREHLLRGGLLERRVPAQELVGEGADGVDVGPGIEIGLAHRLFGRHVGRRAERHADGGELVGAGGAHRLGHAEVGDHGVASGEHHVVGLDVAMNDAMLVGVGEGVDHLAEDAHRLVDGNAAVAREPLAQGFAFHERHDVVEESLGFAGVEQRQDVGVLELGGDADFAHEAVVSEGRGEFGPEHLDRHTRGRASGPRRGRR